MGRIKRRNSSPALFKGKGATTTPKTTLPKTTSSSETKPPEATPPEPKAPKGDVFEKAPFRRTKSRTDLAAVQKHQDKLVGQVQEKHREELKGELQNLQTKAHVTSMKSGLKDHVAKKAEEQKALQSWNTNGAGRNQGLAHLIDYSHARPARTPAGKVSEKNQKVLDQANQTPMTGAKLTEGLGAKDFKKYTDGKAPTLIPHSSEKRPYGFDPSSKKGKAFTAKEAELGALKHAETEKKDAIKTRTNEVLAGLPDTASGKEKGQAIGSDARLRELKADLKANTKAQGEIGTWIAQNRLYTVSREESKKGRLDALGITKGNEVLEGTAKVKAALSDDGKTVSDFSVKVPPESMTGQRKVTDADGKVTWKDATLEKSELSHTTSATVQSGGLEARLWGVLPKEKGTGTDFEGAKDHLKISTVIPKGGK